MVDWCPRYCWCHGEYNSFPYSGSSQSLIGHNSSSYTPQSHLGKSFSSAQYGNSIIAILAGQIANKAANHAEFKPTSEGSGFYTGGYLGPFDVSLFALIVCGLLAVVLWEENYGKSEENDDSSKKSSASGALKTAFQATIRSPDILSCGIISSLFEGSMYIFVFMWTPALTVLAKAEMGDSFDGLPFGKQCCEQSIMPLPSSQLRQHRCHLLNFYGLVYGW